MAVVAGMKKPTDHAEPTKVEPKNKHQQHVKFDDVTLFLLTGGR